MTPFQDWVVDVLARHQDVIPQRDLVEIVDLAARGEHRVAGIDMIGYLLDSGKLDTVDRPAVLRFADAGSFGRSGAHFARTVRQLEALA